MKPPVSLLLTAGLIAAAGSAGFAKSATDGAALLSRAYRAERALSYSALLHTRTASGEGFRESTVRLWKDGARKRMEYPGAPEGATILDVGRSVYRLDETARTAVPLPVDPDRENLDLLLSNYRVLGGGNGRVANRPAVLLKLVPRSAAGPTRHLWIDRATSLILRTDSYSSDNRLRSSSVARTLKVGRPPASVRFAVPPGWKILAPRPEDRRRSLPEVFRTVGLPVREPGVLPRGFRLDGVSLTHTGGGRPSAHLRYTDGLNSLSIFQHSHGPGRGRGRGMGGGMGWGRGGGLGRETPPAVACVLLEGNMGRSLRVFLADRVCLLIADLPEAELRRVAASLR